MALTQFRLGDESALTNWRKWRDLSIEKYREEYGRLNIAFDVYAGESQVGIYTVAPGIELTSCSGWSRRSDSDCPEAPGHGPRVGIQRSSAYRFGEV
jgi:hypothetical protein